MLSKESFVQECDATIQSSIIYQERWVIVCRIKFVNEPRRKCKK